MALKKGRAFFELLVRIKLPVPVRSVPKELLPKTKVVKSRRQIIRKSIQCLWNWGQYLPLTPTLTDRLPMGIEVGARTHSSRQTDSPYSTDECQSVECTTSGEKSSSERKTLFERITTQRETTARFECRVPSAELYKRKASNIYRAHDFYISYQVPTSDFRLTSSLLIISRVGKNLEKVFFLTTRGKAYNISPG